ncbi:hypothetical protein DESC_740181 [Desulfosarcina cetonica]|nr:hypothetical protein DESC_740181 [Desulfosarcina cetonica]
MVDGHLAHGLLHRFLRRKYFPRGDLLTKNTFGEFVKCRAGTNFVVFAVGEMNLAEILGIDRRHVGFPQHQALVAAAFGGELPGVETNLLQAEVRDVTIKRFEVDLLGQFAKSRFIQLDPVDVIAQQDIVGGFLHLLIGGALKHEEVEGAAVFTDGAPDRLMATGKPVGQIDGRRNHDPVVAVKQECRCIGTVANADAQFQNRQLIGLALLVVAVDDHQHIDRQAAGPGHAVPATGGILAFENGQDNGIPFDEDLVGVIIGENFSNRIEEIEAEIGCRVEAPGIHLVGDIG